LTKTEEAAIHGLSKDKNIKIIKADKGNITVLMNSKEYDDKLQELVNTDDYRQLPRDPPSQIEAKVHKELMGWEVDVGTSLKKLAPRYSKPPHLYGLPKVHKNPLRIIVSGIGSTCHDLARFLLNIISLLARKSDSQINNSMDFIKQISQIKMEKGDEMVSFDVVSLFTSVPINEAMAELKLRPESDTKLLVRTTLPTRFEKILDLINVCLNATYFQLGEKFY
jgi:hypothetical protein